MTFNICDGKNQYKACRKCGATVGMGLRHRQGTLAVECDCGHRGLEIPVPTMEDPQWVLGSTSRDEAAFLAWNEENSTVSGTQLSVKESVMHRISWVDSAGMPSHIHATANGTDTVCGGHEHYIANRKLAKAPRKVHGKSTYCRVCFAGQNHNLDWDERCIDVEWQGNPRQAAG